MAHRAGATILRILAIGSSSTSGTGASGPNFTYPAQLRSDLGTIWGIKAEVRNAGIAGERASTTIERLAALMKTKWPDLVLWQVGTNDAITGEDETVFRSELQHGVDLVREAGADLILIDPQLPAKLGDPMLYRHFVGDVADVGRKNHVPVFSRFALMKAWQSASSDRSPAMLANDGFHMSDRGYGCLALRLAQDLATRRGRSVELVGSPAAAPRSTPAITPHSAVLHEPVADKPGGPS